MERALVPPDVVVGEMLAQRLPVPDGDVTRLAVLHHPFAGPRLAVFRIIRSEAKTVRSVKRLR